MAEDLQLKIPQASDNGYIICQDSLYDFYGVLYPYACIVLLPFFPFRFDIESISVVSQRLPCIHNSSIRHTMSSNFQNCHT